MTRVSLSDNLGFKVWPALKGFIVEHNPDANQQVLYMCNYCKPLIKQDVLPARCVLNGLQTVPVPRASCLKLEINEFRCYEVKIEESEKGRQLPGVEPRTPLA